MMRYILLLPLIISLTLSKAQTSFSDVTQASGIQHSFKVLEATFGGGATVLDYNQDGWEDVFLVGGVEGNVLYHNNGDGTFKDVSKEAGLPAIENFATQGVIAADVNKDGYTDLFITTIARLSDESFKKAPNILLLGNQNGTFTDQTEKYGFNQFETFSTGATFGDFNKDGFPDLYVGNYFENYSGSLDKFSGPQLESADQPSKDLIFLNQGGERFMEVSELVGMDHTGLGFGGVWSDYDNDNDLDLLIVNDFGFRATPNLLYRNEYPRLAFTEVSEEVAFNFGINAMGITVGDVNLDGLMDYFVTNLQASYLLLNQGKGQAFMSASKEMGTWYPTIQSEEGYRVTPVSWGANFFDYDNDMDLDLYVANGALNPSLPPNPNQFFEYDNGQFKEIGSKSKTNDNSISRGSVTFDYDNDGDLDLLVINQDVFPGNEASFPINGSRLYRNETIEGNWVKIKLEGKTSETSGIGSRLELYVADKVLIREIDGGSSHESHNSTIAHFGLGTHDQVDSLVIKWSAGERQVVQAVSINQMTTIQEEISGGLQSGIASLAISPNPVTDAAVIEFDLEENSNWSLDLYNILGAKIRHLDSGNGAQGLFLLNDLHNLAQGVYIISVSNSEFTVSEKLFVR